MKPLAETLADHGWVALGSIALGSENLTQRRGPLYVSRGLGMAGLPLRINCPREIALIQLVAEPS